MIDFFASLNWAQWLLVAIILLGTVVRFIKAGGWRPSKRDDLSNVAWFISGFLYPALWIWVLNTAGAF